MQIFRTRNERHAERLLLRAVSQVKMVGQFRGRYRITGMHRELTYDGDRVTIELVRTR